MEILYERTTAIFRKINPAKRYASFEYTDIDVFSDINAGDVRTDYIFKLNGNYYQYYKMNNKLRYCNGSYFLFKDDKIKHEYKENFSKLNTIENYYGNGTVD